MLLSFSPQLQIHCPNPTQERERERAAAETSNFLWWINKGLIGLGVERKLEAHFCVRLKGLAQLFGLQYLPNFENNWTGFWFLRPVSNSLKVQAHHALSVKGVKSLVPPIYV